MLYQAVFNVQIIDSKYLLMLSNNTFLIILTAFSIHNSDNSHTIVRNVSIPDYPKQYNKLLINKAYSCSCSGYLLLSHDISKLLHFK